jgi:glutamate-ammonia-ligase adenylyltransferase
LKYGRTHPQIVHSHVWDALAALQTANLLDPIIGKNVVEHYQFLRTIESRQRMVYQQSLDTLPTAKDDLIKLVRRLGYQEKDPQQAVDHFLIELRDRTARMRTIFLQLIEEER